MIESLEAMESTWRLAPYLFASETNGQSTPVKQQPGCGSQKHHKWKRPSLTSEIPNPKDPILGSPQSVADEKSLSQKGDSTTAEPGEDVESHQKLKGVATSCSHGTDASEG